MGLADTDDSRKGEIMEKCEHCGSDISNDSLKCSVCGNMIELKTPATPESRSVDTNDGRHSIDSNSVKAKEVMQREMEELIRQEVAAEAAAFKLAWDKYSIFWLVVTAVVAYGGLKPTFAGDFAYGFKILLVGIATGIYTLYLLSGGRFRALFY